MAKKTSKKLNRKVKRSARKTVGVLMLIMAIVVAAIPTPKAGAVGGSESDTGVAPPRYPEGDDEYAKRKEKIDPLVPPEGTTPQTAQLIYRSSSGRYYLNNVFEYYMITDSGGNKSGCISKYNNSYQPDAGKLEIPEEVKFEYPDYSYDQVLKYFLNNETKLEDDAGSGINELALYYPEEWKDYQQKKSAYDAYVIALADYNKNTNPNKGDPPATVPEPEKPSHQVKDFLTANEGWVTDNGLRYFCSHYQGKNGDGSSSGATSLVPHITDKQTVTGDVLFSGYILIEVVDERKVGPGSTAVTYMPCYVGTPAEYDVKKDYSDSFFTASTGTNHIRYIGDKAFAGATRILDLVIPKNIEKIGDEAFSGCSGLRNISAYAGTIGNRAFKDCASLESVSLEDGVVTVGAECFRGCNTLRTISFPSTLAKIGFGAFAGCAGLGTIAMDKINVNTVLADYCFFNCPSISGVTFGVNTKEIGEAAFALTEDTAIRNTSWKDVVLPSSVSKLGDYVLYGRGNIETVVMPASYGSDPEGAKLGSGFFGKCINLEYVEFPDNRTGSCGYVSFDTNAFIDVMSENFYIRGPEIDFNKNPATPRKCAWEAGITYVYKDRNNVDQYEVSTGTYRFAVDANGVLTKCTLLKPEEFVKGDGEIVVPATVGTRLVTGIGPDCFSDDNIRDNLKVLKIADGSGIASIADSAFKGYPKLEEVYIGNSVNAIGNQAFADCSKLKTVVYSKPSGGYQNFTIGTDAFATGGSELTFYGDIVPNYAPFAWAMDKTPHGDNRFGNYMNENQGIRVCYKSGTPDFPNLTVLLNDETKEVTLVDYPHYEELDPRIRKRYELYLDGGYTSEDQVRLSPVESEQLNNALHIVIPDGIESIDVKGFLTSYRNANNAFYFTTGRKPGSASTVVPTDVPMPTAGAGTVVDSPPVFDDINYYEVYRNYGLFNGYYGDYVVENKDKNINNGKDYSCEYDPKNDESKQLEKDALGNDRILSVTIGNGTSGTVKSLPDRAFESCENLQTVVLGNAMEDIGTAPFSGCTNLVTVGGNGTYTCNNGIIYKKNDTGLTLVECLPSRGYKVGSATVSKDTDSDIPRVTEITEGAFENCGYIVNVNLETAEQLKRIPRNCFKGAGNLFSVSLPEAVNDIREQAFADTGSYIDVTIPAIEVDIADNAFADAGNVKLLSYSNSAVKRYADRKLYEFKPLENLYKVQFLDYDGTVLSVKDENGNDVAVQYVKENYAADEPTHPTRTDGYIFDQWSTDAFRKVSSDLIVVARYKWDSITYPNTSPGVLPPGSQTTPGGAGAGTPGAGTNGSGTPGAGTPGAGTPGAGTPGAQNSNQQYRLTVQNGSGDGAYRAGTSIIITADAPPAGQRFDRWTSIANDFNITSATSSITTITMPSHDLTIVANYTGASSNGSGNNTNNNSNQTSNTTNGNNNQGTTVDITKPGISNGNLASAVVQGSTDNYVVKISDTAEARAAVEAALINEYGSLNNLRYFAMDISLYDSTGTTKIQDTSNLAINITMPIPDELRQYAGNNQVAGVVNGNVLDKLSPRFTTINGVPCISFTATHFSPYTVYVDTSHLSSSVVDHTPKTGDLIHPKWFLALGLACVSMILLLKKDKKQPMTA